MHNNLVNAELLKQFNKVQEVTSFHVSTLNTQFLTPSTRDSALEYYTILQKK